MLLNIDQVRSQFPSLSSGYIFADNAGGSQVTKDVIHRLTDYLTNTNVQLGADYSIGQLSTQRVASAGVEGAKLVNASDSSEIIFASSSTVNVENIARAIEADVKEGDEFIITGEHEANCGPWKKLASKKAAIIKYWEPRSLSTSNPYEIGLLTDDLLPLISSRTRIVAFTACSNILGSIIPVENVIKNVRERAAKEGARRVEISVDCVAYAPHRKIDVRKWDVDFAFFSFYKVYGPHVSLMYARRESLASPSLASLAHHFLSTDNNPAQKLQPGGQGYEIPYSTTAVLPYLLSLTPSNDLDATFDAIAEHEQILLHRLLGYLTDTKQVERGVRIVGDGNVSMARVPTISFVVSGDHWHKAIRSQDIVKAFDKKGGVGIRYGHFYAYSLVDNLSPKLDINDGVVRISLVHYNTLQEVDRIIEILEEVLA